MSLLEKRAISLKINSHFVAVQNGLMMVDIVVLGFSEGIPVITKSFMKVVVPTGIQHCERIGVRV